MSLAQLVARAWVDGASRGNPGDAGFGVVFELDGDEEEIAGFLGSATNNVAEYAGLIAALTYAAQSKVERLELFSDSQLLVRQLEGTYRVKARHLLPLFHKAMQLRRQIPAVVVQHVRRSENHDADRVANRAIDELVPLPSWLKLPGVVTPDQ